MRMILLFIFTSATATVLHPSPSCARDTIGLGAGLDFALLKLTPIPVFLT